MKRLVQQIQLFWSLMAVTLFTVLVLHQSSLQMRMRNIKPGFFKNEDLGSKSPLARLLYAGLWCLGDRKGRLEDRPRRIKAEVLPYDDCDPDELLNELHPDFILRYEADDSSCIQILNFWKHQYPHVNEKPSVIPPPPVELLESLGLDPSKYYESTVQEPDKHSASTVQEPEDSATNPSCIPVYLTPDTPDNLTPDTPPSSATKEKKTFQEDSQEFHLCCILRSLILANRPGAKVPEESVSKLAGWCRGMDLLLRVDKRDLNEVERVIRWSQADSFWMTNVLSPSSLRRNYDTLAMKMEAGNNGGNFNPKRQPGSRPVDEDRRPKPYVKRERY